MISCFRSYNWLGKGGGTMRAGRLKTGRYKTRGGGIRALLLLTAGIALGSGAAALREGKIALPPFLTAPLSSHAALPGEDETEETILTLPGQSWYALQVGSFGAAGEAQALAESFSARGAGGYVLERDGYQVLAAAYLTRADAQAVQTQLKQTHQVDSVIVEILRPEVTLRLNGRKAQLTVLSDAVSAVCGAADQLSALSARLDRREGDASQIQSALISQRDTLAALADRMDTQFDVQASKEVKALSALLRDLAASLDSAVGARGSTRLGAGIKYGQLLGICRLAAYAESLGR